MGENAERESAASAASDRISEADEKQERVERAAEKKHFRLAALEKRDRLTAERRKDYSGRIVKNLTSLPCYADADAVFTYVSFRSEADTIPLIERAIADGKAVFAPKVTGKEMIFFRIFSPDDLAEGYFGILEPVGGQKFDEWVDDQMSQQAERQQEKPLRTQNAGESGPSALSVLICMPGAAFDRACHRIGYGGGFYDRYLSGAENNAGEDVRAWPQVKITTAALAYDCQIFEEIPWEAHDICPERIITETEVICGEE